MSRRRGYGDGTVRQQGRRSWQIRVPLGADPLTGAWLRHTETITGTKAEAERRRRELRLERDRGTLATPGNKTLEEYLRKEWLTAVSHVSKRGQPLAPTTRRRYGDVVDHVCRLIGDVKLASLRTAHVERLRDEMLSETLERKSGEVIPRFSPQTVGDILRVLSQALRKAEAKGLISRNWADPTLVDRPAGQPRELPPMEEDLAKRILEAVRGEDPWDAAVHLALGLTMRREEVLGLRWPDVDLREGILTVRNTITYTPRQMHEGGPKTEAGRRTVPVPAFVGEALRRHRKQQSRRRLRLGSAWRDGWDVVVDRGDGAPWLPPTFSRAWTSFAKKAGFPDIGFHELRHGAATLMLAAGIPDAVAIKLMGHRDTRILRRYQKVVDRLKREAAGKLDELLGGPGS
ncbi:MAG: tyrosine-type recombinase/integrase [Actinomycetota bacterium]